ncbi:MAG: NAD-dependent succinate-semialdehyde dehydrogenase [Actinomycetota bacterium]
MPFTSINPTTGAMVATYSAHSQAEIEEILAHSATAFAEWRRTSVADRALLMTRAAEILESEVPVVAELMTSEMGKTFAAAKGEVGKCAMTMRYYAEHAARFLATENVSTTASDSGIRYEPLGGVLAIMPWNFPLWQAVRFAAPTLMAGNVGLLKHAENVPGVALYLEGLFRRSGFPRGVFSNLFLEIKDVESVIADSRVAAVTLTGSERAGRSVAALAGRALKKSVMELGGSDAFIVAGSADMEHTVPLAVTARVQNNGQSCIASKRFIVVRERADEFVEKFTAAMSAVVVGDPLSPATVVGPLVSAAQRDLLHAQVSDALAKGARALCGGAPLDGPGFFYPPTVLVDVPADSRAGSEELFGPVAVIHVVEDLAEAVVLANDTPWGLGASIWATDSAEVDYAVGALEAGMVFANAVVASTPELPFGGVKNSGYGRELAAQGIHEFTNAKTFFIA